MHCPRLVRLGSVADMGAHVVTQTLIDLVIGTLVTVSLFCGYVGVTGHNPFGRASVYDDSYVNDVYETAEWRLLVHVAEYLEVDEGMSMHEADALLDPAFQYLMEQHDSRTVSVSPEVAGWQAKYDWQ